MEWLNEHAGFLVLLFSVILVLLLGLAIWLLISLRNKIAVQRLKFIGLYSTDPDTRENFAKITVGNRSLNDVGISEIGIKNGKVNFDFTPLYRKEKRLEGDTRIVVEQRNAIEFVIPARELCKTLLDGKNGKKELKTLRVYVIDATGIAYQARIPAVQALLKNMSESGTAARLLAESKNYAGEPVSIPEEESTVSE